MIPLLEMMLKTQNGEGISQIQKQFGLDADQAEKALGAVLPAFSTGLKRNTAAPMDIGAFMQALSGGQHAKYIDDTQAAFSDDGVVDGNGILKHLFGSKDTSRAVAAQAAQVSGVGEDTIKKMLPVVASMIMGRLFKQSTGQTEKLSDPASAGAIGGGGGILGQILEGLVKGGIGNQGGSQTQNQPRDKQAGSNPLGELLEQMMGGSKRGADQSSDRQGNNPGNPFGGDNPLGNIFEDFLGGKRDDHQAPEETRRQPRRSQPERDSDQDDDGFEDIGSAEQYDRRQSGKGNRQRNAPQDQPRQKSGLEDLFGDMFETGQDDDPGYQRGIESIFDKFMKR